MAREMEFGDKVRKLEGIEVNVRVVLRETFEVMEGPFAGNVVRNDDVYNSHTFQYRRNNIICVDVSRR